MEGQVAIEMRVPSHGKVRIFTAEPLDIIGWSSLTPVARQRTASARATLPSRLISLDAEALFHFCEEDHDLGYVIMRRLSNVITSRLLTTRLALIDLLVYQGQRYPTSTTILE
jgi:CRP-like cAMP-binding protein